MAAHGLQRVDELRNDFFKSPKFEAARCRARFFVCDAFAKRSAVQQWPALISVSKLRAWPGRIFCYYFSV
jgi:hypothetical protein